MKQDNAKYLDWLKNYLEEIYKTDILEKFLDIEFLEIEEGKVSFQCTINKIHKNLYGYVHGGAFASICDIAMGVSCLTYDKEVVTIDMSTSYIRNVPVGNKLVAKRYVISQGKTIFRASGEIYHDTQLLVKSQASYFVTGDFKVKHEA